jgi:hypothetical protein
VKRLAVAAGLTAALLGVAGCAEQTAGTPTGVGPTATDGSQPSGPSSTLPVNQPCSLLSSSDLDQLGASTPSSQDVIGGAQTCEVTVTNGSLEVAFPGFGLSRLVVTGPVTDLRIGQHQAKKMTDPQDSGSCYIAIGITSTQRVDVGAETDGGTEPCPLAMKAAQLVEQRLPVLG